MMEALRLRRKGEANYITYKGPKSTPPPKLATRSSSRSAPARNRCPPGPPSWKRSHCGQRAKFASSRRKPRPWQGRQVDASLDDVQGVGTFVEFELVVEQSEVDAARACIQSLAQSLGLTQGERRSYLELLRVLHKGT